MSSRRPVILVATSYGLNRHGTLHQILLPEDYVSSVVAAGGVPLLVPPMADGPAWRRWVRTGDALMVVGGPDIDPAAYGHKPHPKTVPAPPKRLAADARLVAWADRRRLPVLGICLGIQTLVVHRGGTLFQHIPDDVPGALQHHRDPRSKRPRHMVRIDPASRLARIVGHRALSVNTSHHQAADSPGRHLRPVAWATDGIVEAVEDDRPDRFVLGVQWHPETLPRAKRHGALFRALVKAARTAR